MCVFGYRKPDTTLFNEFLLCNKNSEFSIDIYKLFTFQNHIPVNNTTSNLSVLNAHLTIKGLIEKFSQEKFKSLHKY